MTNALFGDNPDHLCPHCGVMEANEYVFNLNHRPQPNGGCQKQALLTAHTRSPMLTGPEREERIRVASQYLVKVQQEVKS